MGTKRGDMIMEYKDIKTGKMPAGMPNMPGMGD